MLVRFSRSFLFFGSLASFTSPVLLRAPDAGNTRRRKKNNIKMLFQHFCFNMRHSSCTLATQSSLVSGAVATGMAIRVDADNVCETHASAPAPHQHANAASPTVYQSSGRAARSYYVRRANHVDADIAVNKLLWWACSLFFFPCASETVMTGSNGYNSFMWDYSLLHHKTTRIIRKKSEFLQWVFSSGGLEVRSCIFL